MFCSNCGKPLPDGASFCPSCGVTVVKSTTRAAAAPLGGAVGLPAEVLAGGPPVAAAVPAPPVVKAPDVDVRYGGFWRRFWAILIDGCILNLLTVPFIIGLVAATKGLNPVTADANAACGFLAGSVMVWVGRIIMNVLYPALFESSTWQASPGKRLLGLRVTNLQGERISFPRALVRTMAKGLSGMLLGFGFILAAFDKQKQGLHDMLADTVVCRT